jgi:hypothetical protein
MPRALSPARALWPRSAGSFGKHMADDYAVARHHDHDVKHPAGQPGYVFGRDGTVSWGGLRTGSQA